MKVNMFIARLMAALVMFVGMSVGTSYGAADEVSSKDTVIVNLITAIEADSKASAVRIVVQNPWLNNNVMCAEGMSVGQKIAAIVNETSRTVYTFLRPRTPVKVAETSDIDECPICKSDILKTEDDGGLAVSSCCHKSFHALCSYVFNEKRCPLCRATCTMKVMVNPSDAARAKLAEAATSVMPVIDPAIIDNLMIAVMGDDYATVISILDINPTINRDTPTPPNPGVTTTRTLGDFLTDDVTLNSAGNAIRHRLGIRLATADDAPPPPSLSRNFGGGYYRADSPISRDDYPVLIDLSDGEIPPPHNDRPLHAAVRRNDIVAVTALLDSSTPINEINGAGETPIQIAASEDFLPIFNLLRSRSTNMTPSTSSDSFFSTVLYNATGHVKDLLSAESNAAYEAEEEAEVDARFERARRARARSDSESDTD